MTNSSSIIDAQYEFLNDTELILLSTLLTVHIDVEPENNPYARLITDITILKAQFLIFNLFRLGNEPSKQTYIGSEDKIWCGNEVIYEPDIYVGDDLLSCYAIVIHTGDCHYVAVAKYGDFWYYYDDYLKTSNSKYTMIKFNSIEEIVEASTHEDSIFINPLTNGTQFYYRCLEYSEI